MEPCACLEIVLHPGATTSRVSDSRHGEGSVAVSLAGVAALLVLATVRSWGARDTPVSGGVTLCFFR